jgi:hypothetical protein
MDQLAPRDRYAFLYNLKIFRLGKL